MFRFCRILFRWIGEMTRLYSFTVDKRKIKSSTSFKINSFFFFYCCSVQSEKTSNLNTQSINGGKSLERTQQARRVQ